ncbi:MAG: alpha/beta hydrolase [Propioniciclava sp.]
MSTTIAPQPDVPRTEGVSAAGWRPDPVISGFESCEVPLTAPPEAGEPDQPLVATLIRRADPQLRTSRGAVLHVHGWNDYFYQTHLADQIEGMGLAFYAVDLRRYGRSFREGQFHGYVADLSDYAEELDQVTALIRADHDRLLLMGHSTGGLTASLWAAANPGRVAGLALNSPWLDLQGPAAAAGVLRPLLDQWGRHRPTAVIPVPEWDEPVFVRATHVKYHGEWTYDLALKSDRARPIRVGWLRAVLRGHRQVAAGLDIDCPIFVATSAETVWLRRYSPRARSADTVLSVDDIGVAATRLGHHVTLVRIEGGIHDLALSDPPAREAYFSHLAHWVGAYVSADSN